MPAVDDIVEGITSAINFLRYRWTFINTVGGDQWRVDVNLGCYCECRPERMVKPTQTLRVKVWLDAGDTASVWRTHRRDGSGLIEHEYNLALSYANALLAGAVTARILAVTLTASRRSTSASRPSHLPANKHSTSTSLLETTNPLRKCEPASRRNSRPLLPGRTHTFRNYLHVKIAQLPGDFIFAKTLLLLESAKQSAQFRANSSTRFLAFTIVCRRHFQIQQHQADRCRVRRVTDLLAHAAKTRWFADARR